MASEWVSLWWQASLLPKVWDVCGIRIPSLTVWHTFALENVGNPYLCGGDCDMDAVASLVLVCQSDREGFERMAMRPRLLAKTQRRIFAKIKCYTTEKANAAAREYVDVCTRAADRAERQGGKGSAAPYQFHLVRCLTRDYGMTLDEAWSTPYAVARCYFDAASEAEGDTSLVSQKAQAFLDQQEAE